MERGDDEEMRRRGPNFDDQIWKWWYGKKMDNRDEAKVAKAAFKGSRDYADAAVRQALAQQQDP